MSNLVLTIAVLTAVAFSLLTLLRSLQMPTVAELKVAVAEAVGQEAAEVATRLKALEDEVVALKEQVANGATITQADMDDVLTSIRGIFTPA